MAPRPSTLTTVVQREKGHARYTGRGRCSNPLAGLSRAAVCAAFTFAAWGQAGDFQQRLTAGRNLRGAGEVCGSAAGARIPARRDAATRRRQQLGGNRHRLLGCNAHDLGNHAEAERLFTSALSILKRLNGAESPDATTIKMHLAELYWEEGRAREAEILLRKVVAAREREPRRPPPMWPPPRSISRWPAARKARSGKPRNCCAPPCPPIESSFGADSPMLLSVLDPLASVLTSLHRYSEALGYSERAWKIIQHSPQVAGPDRVNTTIALSSLYSMTGQPKEAAYFAGEGLALVESVYQPDNPRVGWYLKTYAAVLRRLNRKEEAKAAEKRAAAILAASSGGRSRQTVNVSALR